MDHRLRHLLLLLVIMFGAMRSTSVWAGCTPLVTLSSSPGDTICAGTLVTFSASPISGGATNTYRWIVNGVVVSTVGPTYSYNPINGDSVRVVRLTSGGTCDGTETVSSITRHMVVTSAPLPVTISGPSHICTALSATYTASGPGGVWSSPSATVSVNPATGVVNGLSDGTATLSYSIVNGCGSARATKTVTVGALPAITGKPILYCLGHTDTLSIDATGGIWTSSAPWAAKVDSFSGVVTGLADGTAPTIYYTVSPGCYVQYVITVIDKAPPITGSTIQCAGTTYSQQLRNSDTTGRWSTTSTFASIDSVSGHVLGIAAGQAIITYTINGNCINTFTLNVLATPPRGVITGDSVICTGLTISLSETETGGNWSSSNTSIAIVGSDNGIVTALAPGTVLIRYTTPTNSVGCFGTASHQVTVEKADFKISGVVKHVSCYGAGTGSISTSIVGGQQPFDYFWSNSGTGPELSGLQAGRYILSAREQSSGCIAKDTFNIRQPDSMQVITTITDDSCGAKFGVIHLSVSGATPPYTFKWDNNTTDSVLKDLVRGRYSVTITDSLGCIRTLQPEVKDLGCVVGVHDVLTPNGDGANDKWVIEGLWLYPANVVQVFDKWGDLVYEKANYNADWTGQNKSGQPLPDGSYFYLLRLNDATLPEGGVYKGIVLLKR